MKTKKKKKVGRRILCFVLAVVLMFSSEGLLSQVNGSGGESIQAQAATVRLNRTSCVLDIGKAMKLKLIGTKSKATWYTSNKSIATVSNTGCVAAQKAGKAVITAKIGTKRYKCTVVVSSKRLLRYTTRAVYDGKYVFFGVDYYRNKLGAIYRYNTQTGEKSKIASLWNWEQLTSSGNYLYTDVADQNGGKYIYKISKDGRYKKNLGRGKSPVVIGNSIYYVGHTQQGATSFGEETGIYKMDLNGSNKKCLYKKKSGEYIGITGVYKEKLLIFVDSTEYLMDTNAKMNRVNITRSYANCNMGSPSYSYYDNPRMLYISNNTFGYKYFINSNKLIRRKGNSESVICSFDHNILNIVDMGDYIFVQTVGSDNSGMGTYNLYLVTKTGKTIKALVKNVGQRGGR